jgi:hypothetical protein
MHDAPLDTPRDHVSIDALIDLLQIVLGNRYPDAEWGSVVIHRPGMPNITLTVRQPARGPRPESRLVSPPAL